MVIDTNEMKQKISQLEEELEEVYYSMIEASDSEYADLEIKSELMEEELQNLKDDYEITLEELEMSRKASYV